MAVGAADGIPGVIGAGRLREAGEERAGVAQKGGSREKLENISQCCVEYFSIQKAYEVEGWEPGVQGTGSKNFTHLVIRVIIFGQLQRRPLRAPPAATISGKVGYLAGKELAIVIVH